MEFTISELKSTRSKSTKQMNQQGTSDWTGNIYIRGIHITQAELSRDRFGFPSRIFIPYIPTRNEKLHLNKLSIMEKTLYRSCSSIYMYIHTVDSYVIILNVITKFNISSSRTQALYYAKSSMLKSRWLSLSVQIFSHIFSWRREMFPYTYILCWLILQSFTFQLFSEEFMNIPG